MAEWVCPECGSVNESTRSLRCDCGFAGRTAAGGGTAPAKSRAELEAACKGNDLFQEMLRRADAIKNAPKDGRTPGQLAKELAEKLRVN